MAALNHEGAGVRGGNPWAEFCHPGRSLVLSRERESTSNTKDNKQRERRGYGLIRLPSELSSSSGIHLPQFGEGNWPFLFGWTMQRPRSSPLRLCELFLEAFGFSKGACFLCAAARSRGLAPVPHQGLRGPGPRKGQSPLNPFFPSLVYGTKSSISISLPTSVKVSGTSPTMMDSAIATWVVTSTVCAPVGITICTCAVSARDTRCRV